MRRSFSTYFLVGGLALLLVTLGVLQYRAVTQISEADAEKTRRLVQENTGRFAADFNREIQNAYFNFQADASVWKEKNWQPFNERYDYWRDKTAYPELITGFYFFEAKGDVQPLRYDREQRAFLPAEANDELAEIRKRSMDEGHFTPFHVDLQTLVLPVHEAGPEMEKIVIHRSPASAGAKMQMPPKFGFLAIKLNEAVIKEQLLPALTAKYFGDGEFRTAVTDKAGAPVFASLAGENTDATAPLFSLAPDNFIQFKSKELLDSISAERRADVTVTSRVESQTFNKVVTPDGKAQTVKIELRKSDKDGPPVLARISDSGDPPWTLAVQHSSGSLDGHIASTLRRNLAIGFGILVLLAAAVAAIIISSMRARALAQRQLEFVSSVSHEFRTPLAVIYSAGENLADGVTKEPSQISGYGDLIKCEGQKLSSMVEQILEFAGARSGNQRYTFRPVAVDDVVDDAVSQCRSLIDERGSEMKQNIASGLPLLNADKRALSQALQNLVANSIKYSDGTPWLCVTAANGDGKVRITVEDRGIGIAKSDLKQIFEPFYRAKTVVDAQIHGNGLGLSLVKQIAEAHGGRVYAESEVGVGSKFTVELPQE